MGFGVCSVFFWGSRWVTRLWVMGFGMDVIGRDTMVLAWFGIDGPGLVAWISVWSSAHVRLSQRFAISIWSVGEDSGWLGAVTRAQIHCLYAAVSGRDQVPAGVKAVRQLIRSTRRAFKIGDPTTGRVQPLWTVPPCT